MANSGNRDTGNPDSLGSVCSSGEIDVRCMVVNTVGQAHYELMSGLNIPVRKCEPADGG